MQRSASVGGFFVRYFFATLKVFSATETQAKRSSMVAMSVCSRVLHSTFVRTSDPFLTVSMCSPGGTSMLSGETAFATASASRSFW